MSVAYDIIKAHLTTERTTLLRTTNNEYVFEVDKRADKLTIKRAVEEAFKVKVDSVRTMVIPGKVKRIDRRYPGRTSSWKKAIVRLKKDQVIGQFDQV